MKELGGVAMRWMWGALLGVVIVLQGCVQVVTPAAAVQARRAMPPPGSAQPPEPPSPVDANGHLTQRGFAAELATVLEHESPGSKAVNNGDEIVELWFGDAPGVTLPVGPAYAEYQQDPARRQAIITEAVQGALALYAAADSWERGRGRVLPRLVSQEHFQKIAASGALPVDVQLSDDVYMIFEVRVNGKPYLVHQGLQVTWGQPSSVLYAQALSNLDTVTPPLTRDTAGIWRFPVDDDYGITRILLVKRFADAAAQVPTPLVIAIPAYDRLYAFEDTDPKLVERMQMQTEVDYNQAGEPFSTQWLTLSDGKLVLYEPKKG